ncbi:MAG: hypothetical protein ABW172_14265 [Candidatus Binatia bacterium]
MKHIITTILAATTFALSAQAEDSLDEWYRELRKRRERREAEAQQQENERRLEEIERRQKEIPRQQEDFESRLEFGY